MKRQFVTATVVWPQQKRDADRVARYVEMFVLRAKRRAHRTAWPTIRQVARSLRWTQRRVEGACFVGDGQLFVSYRAPKPGEERALGDRRVELWDYMSFENRQAIKAAGREAAIKAMRS